MNDKPKVLMIDDARMMHGVVKSRLVADGLDFHSTYGGEEGIALAQQIRPDVILLDVEMPAPDGFEVCRRLKGDPHLSNIPIIFLSGVTTSEEKIRGLNLGAIDYVTKPFDAAELQARVRASLRYKELLDLLSQKAMIDGLTGLWNRSHLNARLAEELANFQRHRRPLACLMVDVDHFKSINDTHGHGFGDVVLKGIAATIQKTCRTEDIACRYGGEEFIVLAREANAASAMLFAERIRTAVAGMTFKCGSVPVSVTCSIGVAESNGDGTLVDAADQALYASKHNGRNRATLFIPELAKPVAA